MKRSLEKVQSPVKIRKKTKTTLLAANFTLRSPSFAVSVASILHAYILHYMHTVVLVHSAIIIAASCFLPPSSFTPSHSDTISILPICNCSPKNELHQLDINRAVSSDQEGADGDAANVNSLSTSTTSVTPSLCAVPTVESIAGAGAAAATTTTSSAAAAQLMMPQQSVEQLLPAVVSSESDPNSLLVNCDGLTVQQHQQLQQNELLRQQLLQHQQQQSEQLKQLQLQTKNRVAFASGVPPISVSGGGNSQLSQLQQMQHMQQQQLLSRIERAQLEAGNSVLFFQPSKKVPHMYVTLTITQAPKSVFHVKPKSPSYSNLLFRQSY